MRKLSKLGLIALVLASLISGATTVAAHTESAPYTTTLIAGQYIQMGTVSVWNDGTSLYVKYKAEGWVITETHFVCGHESACKR